MAADKITFESSRFGIVEVPAECEIEIFGGIIGFPGQTRFTLLEYNTPFSWLHSTEQKDLAFVVVNAAEFGDEYEFKLPYGDREIDLKEDDEIAIINLVSVRPDPMMTTVNLKAPLIVNMRNRKGRQIILDNPKFPVRMPLWVKEESKAE